jgi:hypothetical protein
MADQSDRPEPDFDVDPRRGEVSDRGYPESEPAGAAGGSDYPHEGPEKGSDVPGDEETSGAPSPSSREEREAGQATGNPRAAG